MLASTAEVAKSRGAAPSQTTMVEVVAPSNMAEGHTFYAEYDGITFPVVVPPGGVVAGQSIAVPFVPPQNSTTSSGTTASTGAWKDNLCSCCKFGPLHSSLCLSCWCQPVAMAQVMTRLRLDWVGLPAKGNQWRHTFRNLIIALLVYWLAYIANRWIVWETVVSITFFVAIVVVLIRVRRTVRERDFIPESETCSGCEDCCCSFWCTCCVTAQLARHTAEYDKEPARCCSETGLLSDEYEYRGSGTPVARGATNPQGSAVSSAVADNDPPSNLSPVV